MRFYLIDKNTYFHFGKAYNFRVAPIFYHNYTGISIIFGKLFETFRTFLFLLIFARYAQTRKVMKLPYLSRIALQRAHKQCFLKSKSVTYHQ